MSEESCRTGCVFVFSGPSGTGKTTLAWEVIRHVPAMEFSVSYTTRPPRDGEKEGVDYRFVDRAEFERRRGRGEFAEWAEVFGNLYGTHRGDLERVVGEGRDIVLDIDIQGALQVRRARPESVLVFILPPDLESLRQRLVGRATDRAEVIDSRLQAARSEIEHAFEFDYLVVNDSLEEASSRLEAVVRAERQRRSRQEAILRRILASFPVAPEPRKGASRR